MTQTRSRYTRITGPARDTLARELRDRYDKGASVRELAEMIGRSYGFAYRLLQEAGTEMRRRGFNDTAVGDQPREDPN